MRRGGTVFSLLSVIWLFVSGCGGDTNVSPSLGDMSGTVDGGATEVAQELHPRLDVSAKPEASKQNEVTSKEEAVVLEPKPGGPCTKDSDCYQAPCVYTPTGKQCSMVCVDDCKVEGWECFPQLTGWTPGLCLQPDWYLCRPCKEDADCLEKQSGRQYTCIDYPDGSRYCAKACKTALDCPGGFECREATFNGKPLPEAQCRAKSGSCPCIEAHEGAQSVCWSTNDIGSCPGTLTCSQGVYTCDAPQPTQEVCNGKDDDCDGEVDEDLGKVTCGLGICQHEQEACVNGKKTFCNPMEGATAETCNGLDDNCNGETDELWPEVGTPCDTDDPDFCANGTWVCSADGKDVVCEGDSPVGPEMCDGKDNDCDGLTDEDLGETSCGLGECFHTVPNCKDGVEQECDPMEGAKDEDVPDLAGKDENCDGVDGELARAVFVSASKGSDVEGDGTPEKPLKSLAAAVEMAMALKKDHIYVSQGVFPEPFPLDDGLSFFGKFNDKWLRDPLLTTTAGTGNPALWCSGVSNAVVDGFSFNGENAEGVGESAYGGFFNDCHAITLANCFIIAGNGTNGLPGVDGQDGADGGPGGSGLGGCTYGFLCGDCNSPVGGSGGLSPCGMTGGDGGNGGASGKSGAAGAEGEGGTPGGAGGLPKESGSPGQDGEPGANGAHGGGSEWKGNYGPSGFEPVKSEDGKDGTNGKGGGGGGGGGGGTQAGIPACKVYGASGGGGGGGGCHGTKGTGGTGGGGSFGLYLVNSDVVLENTKIFAGIGGKGGPGGVGGKGGKGGDGGEGGIGKIHNAEGGGGKGGNGGKGGDGGGGAGGNGGPAVGVLCQGNSSVVDAGGNVFSFTAPGAPGGAQEGAFPGAVGQSGGMVGCGNGGE